MAGSEKGMSFSDPVIDSNKLELLHSHTRELKRIDQSNESLLSKQAIPHKLPLKLPQRRKFLTLSMHNSADSEVNLHRNSPALDAEIERRRVPVQKEGQKAMDLGAMEGTSELQMAMESNLAGEEQRTEKQKLLVQLTGMNPGAGKIKAFHESSNKACNEGFKPFHESFKDLHKSFEGFHESSVGDAAPSNPSRVCRFCSREFPSGRALGGHMRVHGALLDVHTSVNMKQEKLGSKGIDTRSVAADLTTSEFLEEREKASLLYSEESEKASMKMTSSTSLHRAETVCLHQEERRDNHVLDLSYYDCSSGYGLGSRTDNRQILASDCTESASLSSESKKHHGALYELRRNPKPNQKFIKELHVAQITDSMNANCRSGDHSTTPVLAENHMRSSPSPSPERARPCSECGKVFFSWKALFGHMRCHPEREWRGIQRPDSSNIELDRTQQARMIVPRPSAEGLMELCYGDYNKNSCTKVENTEETTDISTLDSKKEEKNIVSFVIHGKGGMAASSVDAKEPGVATDTDCNTGGKDEEGKANKDECINSKHAEAMRHAHTEEMTDDWTPIWSSAGKRSKRRRVSHTHRQPALTSETTSNEIKFNHKGPGFKDQEDLDMANCLVLLSSAGKCMQEVNKMCVESTEESAFSHPGEARRAFSNADQWERASDAGDGDDGVEDRVRVHVDYDAEDHDADDDDEAQNNGSHVGPMLIKYQCSTCKKCFNSHQALGGHRASHRKMKGCFARMKSLVTEDAAHESSEENNNEEAEFLTSEHIKGQNMKHTKLQQEERARTCADPLYRTSKKKFKGHECSICHRIFATGQALGGHKRCHWTGEKAPADTASGASSNNYSTSNNKQLSPKEKAEWGSCRESSAGLKRAVKEDVIDLNLPAPLDDDDEVGFDAACGVLMCTRLRPTPMWNQQEWNPAKVAQIPVQVCSMQTL